MKMTEVSVKRPVTIAMVFLCVILLGVVSLSKLALDLMPNITYPMAMVITSYSDAGPEEVENNVTIPMENALGAVSGIDTISSNSSRGSSMVMATFNWGTDMNFATLRMREKVDLVKGMLPDDADNPMIIQADPSMMPVIYMSLSGGKDLSYLKTLAEDTIQPRLERQNGVASVEIQGGYSKEIQVIPDPVKMRAYNLTIASISQMIQADNNNFSTGTVETAGKDIIVRAVGRFTSMEDLGLVQIPTGAGTVNLSEIAQIVETNAEVTGYGRINGEDGLAISISKQSDANTVEVSNNVKRAVAQLERELPENVSLNVIMDSADYINGTIDNLVQTLITGSILSILVLLLFLRSIKSTIVIALSIPISLIGTFVLMFFNDVTLNIMSLGGLSLGLGMMVDSSIVVLENIYRHNELGENRETAAIKGASEMGLAVIASTLTTVAVFLPMVFTEGIASMMMRDMSLTVSFSLLMSLVVALTLVPMLCSKLISKEELDELEARRNSGAKQNIFVRMGEKFNNWFMKFEEKYKQLLNWALHHRKKVVLGVVLAFVVSFFLIPVVGMELMPASDEGQISINISLEDGTILETTNEVVKQAEEIILDYGDVIDLVFTNVSGSSGSITVMLVPLEERKVSSDDVAEDLRKRLAMVPGADIYVSGASSSGMGGMGGGGVSIQLQGDDLETLQKVANDVVGLIEGVDGVREASSSLEDAQPEYVIRVNRLKASQYGLSLAQIATAARSGFSGNVASVYRVDGNEYDIRVILPEEYRQSITDMENIMVSTSSGSQVPLGDVAEFSLEAGPNSISRENQIRQVTVSASIYDRDLNSVISDINKKIAQYPMPEGYSVVQGGSYEMMMESFGSLGLALILAIVLVYMIMAALYESFIYPFVILFSLPTALIGVIFSLALTGRALSMPALMGCIMLAGIVVNNGIVLVDYINQLRAQGMNKEEAIVTGSPTRLRPVLMSTLTTVLGMLPMAIGAGDGGSMTAPLGTVVAGGLTISTIFTMVFVPVVYSITVDKEEKRKAKRLARKQARKNKKLQQEGV